MSVNEKIIAALETLGYPVVPDLYAGTEEVYLTFNYSAAGALFADDAPGYDIYLVQVHLLAPHGWNGVSVRKQIKRCLLAAGFTWPEETDAGNESQMDNSKGQHLVFECQMEEGAEDG